MKNLVDYIQEELDFENPIQKDDQQANQLDGGLDAALAGEIFLFSQTDTLFIDREDAIVKRLKSSLKPEQLATDYIAKTPIFKLYVKDVINGYRDAIDKSTKINISTFDEISRQVADEMLLKLKNTVF